MKTEEKINAAFGILLCANRYADQRKREGVDPEEVEKLESLQRMASMFAVPLQWVLEDNALFEQVVADCAQFGLAYETLVNDRQQQVKLN